MGTWGILPWTTDPSATRLQGKSVTSFCSYTNGTFHCTHVRHTSSSIGSYQGPVCRSLHKNPGKILRSPLLLPNVDQWQRIILWSSATNIGRNITGKEHHRVKQMQLAFQPQSGPFVRRLLWEDREGGQAVSTENITQSHGDRWHRSSIQYMTVNH